MHGFFFSFSQFYHGLNAIFFLKESVTHLYRHLCLFVGFTSEMERLYMNHYRGDCCYPLNSVCYIVLYCQSQSLRTEIQLCLLFSDSLDMCHFILVRYDN